tara:strand:+ start:7747 stop:8043 length:297 start_codon:yes stop_codon:yes gene_type:complete
MILLNTTGGGMPFLLMMGAMFIVMYFFMIRPQVKKQKKEIAYRSSLKKGDKIMTIGGIHGKVVEIKDTTVDIEVNSGVRLRIEKSAISMSGETSIEKK